MKIKIELEIDLGDKFINPKDKEEHDWLFNHIWDNYINELINSDRCDMNILLEDFNFRTIK